ncbi:hypothetical protein N665_0192s0005 [Sinapis alba]|nr:hypothetical protein N665_0192s0005 [Sinapis alba]
MTVLPAPTKMKDIRNCLGNALFCRRFIKYFSKIARPLTTLLCKEVKFDVTLDYLNAFKEIKLEFTFRTNMHHTRFRIRRSTWTEKEKKLHVVYYASRTLDDAQINCATTEKELLTVVFSFKFFYHHLVGSKRWIMLFQEFDIEIKDKRGVENRFSDHRTRNRNEDEVPIDDFLPTKNVYDIESTFIGIVRVTSEEVPIDTHEHRPTPQTRNNLIHLQKRAVVEPETFKGDTKNKILREIQRYYWDVPYLYKQCYDGIYRRPFTIKEIRPYGTILLINAKGEEFMVNEERVKHYWAKADIPYKQIMRLGLPTSD